MKEYAVRIKNVSMEFNLASEKAEGLKEYVINIIRGKNIKIETYLVIEASENGKNTFTATEYRLEKEGESKYRASQKKFPLQRKDGILEKDFSKRYYIENGKLRENTAKEDYEHVSDKSMTFEELNNGRGYPAPK